MKQIGRSGTGPGWARGEGVNDMYTQTGRTGRERKGKHRGKQNVEGGEGRRVAEKGTRLKCLGSSDDSQSSCLLASRFPFPQRRPFVSVSSLFPSSSPPLFPLPATPSPRLRVSLFCSSRTHRCGTSIVLKLFHLLAPPPRARPVFVTRHS